MINLRLSTLDAMKRLNERSKTNRSRPYDQSMEMILNRLDEYEKKTKPVIDYYKRQNIYFEVDGGGNKEEVYNRLEVAVKEAYRKIH
jgi:adenylate kinase